MLNKKHNYQKIKNQYHQKKKKLKQDQNKLPLIILKVLHFLKVNKN